MSVYIVHSCFLIFATYLLITDVQSISFNSHVEIDQSPVFDALLRICDLSIRYGERRSVKLFSHSRILYISSLKYFDYSPFSSSFFSSRSNTFIYAIIHTHTCTHTFSSSLSLFSFFFPPFVYFKHLIRKNTDRILAFGERSILC